MYNIQPMNSISLIPGQPVKFFAINLLSEYEMPEFVYECIVDRGFHWRAKSSSLVVFVYSSVASPRI